MTFPYFIRLEDKKYPNTYTLSKALSEELVYSYRTKIPVVVVRPALIWFAHKEPFAGFVEGLHGGVGLICGGMTGFLRTMYMKPDCVVSITPVDFTINATLAAAWKRSTLDNDDFLIYNCADIYEHQTSWQKMFKVASDYSTEFTVSLIRIMLQQILIKLLLSPTRNWFGIPI